MSYSPVTHTSPSRSAKSVSGSPIVPAPVGFKPNQNTCITSTMTCYFWLHRSGNCTNQRCKYAHHWAPGMRIAEKPVRVPGLNRAVAGHNLAAVQQAQTQRPQGAQAQAPEQQVAPTAAFVPERCRRGDQQQEQQQELLVRLDNRGRMGNVRDGFREILGECQARARVRDAGAGADTIGGLEVCVLKRLVGERLFTQIWG